MYRILQSLALLACSVFICFLCLEGTIRLALSHKISALEYFRDPDLFADWFTDDYWKLEGLINNGNEQTPHPLLGWIGDFDPNSYRHNDTGNLNNRIPVILFGDSFAQCSAPTPCFEEILNSYPELNKNHYLLNYGVNGYGLDQISLLMEQVIPKYPNAKIIFSFMTLDLDRVVLSVRPQQKPRFSIKDTGLVLHKPLPLPFSKYLALHPPGINSYALRFLQLSLLSDQQIDKVLEIQKQKDQSIAIASLILDRTFEQLHDQEEDYLVVVFSPHWPGISTLHEETWRDNALKKYFAHKSETVLWAKDVARLHGERFGGQPYDYIKMDGHPNEQYNRLISQLLKQWLLNSPTTQKG